MLPIEKIPRVRPIRYTQEQLVAFETEIACLYDQGKIKAPIHLSDGNELQLIHLFEKIAETDLVFSTWRSHYHALLHGVDAEWLKRQILNKKSMGIIKDYPFIYSSSIVCGAIPAALGAAYSITREGKGRRAWLFVGDMTARTGVFHEAYNYAKSHNLSLQIVVEDNGKSVTTDTAECWNSDLKLPVDIYHYKFQSRYPHHGTGSWVNF